MFIVTDCLKDVHKLFTVPKLILNSYIFTEKVLKTINRLLNKKTAESNRILNEILKRIILTLSTGLI